MKRRSPSKWPLRAAFATGVGALGLGAIASTSCSSDPGTSKTASSTATSGAGGAYVSASGPALVVTTSSATSSSSVFNGSTTSAGGGDDPVWSALANPPLGCPTWQIDNPTRVRAFSWEPCVDAPNCEQMVFGQKLGNFFILGLLAHEDAQGAFVAVQQYVQGPGGRDFITIFADEDGWSKAAFQSAPFVPNNCWQQNMAMWGGRFALAQTADPNRVGGIIYDYAQKTPPAVFETLPLLPGIYPGNPSPMGTKRWAWDVSALSMWSVAAKDGLDAEAFAKTISPVIELDDLDSCGDFFLIDVVQTVGDGGTVQGLIGQSDGVHPWTPYVVPPPGSFYRSPSCADSHVIFWNCFDVQSASQCSSMELWAAPLEADPSKLAPFKLADYPHTNTYGGSGGHGYFAALDDPALSNIALWNIATREKRVFPMPGGEAVRALSGITAHYLYGVAAPGPGIAADRIVRFPLTVK